MTLFLNLFSKADDGVEQFLSNFGLIKYFLMYRDVFLYQRAWEAMANSKEE